MSKKNRNRPAGVKTPQDHQRPRVPFTQVEGHELLVPPNELTLEQGIDLIGALEEGEGNLSIRQIKTLLTTIRDGGYVRDEEGFKAFAHGGNLGAALKLIVAYVEELSKGVA